MKQISYLVLVVGLFVLGFGCSHKPPTQADNSKQNASVAASVERTPAQMQGCDFTKFDGEGMVPYAHVPLENRKPCFEAEKAGKNIVGFTYWVRALGRDYWFNFLEIQKRRVMNDFFDAAKMDSKMRCQAMIQSDQTCIHLLTFFTGMEEGKGFARSLYIVQ